MSTILDIRNATVTYQDGETTTTALADASLLTIVLIAAPAGVQVWVEKLDTRRNSRVNALCTASSEGYLQPLW